MLTIPYDSSNKSLLQPGLADDFFQPGRAEIPIENFLNNEAALCAEMSRLAYVKQEELLELYLDRAGFKKDLAIDYNTDGTQAYVASSRKKKLTIVGFRGTEPADPRDIMTNINFIFTPWKDGLGNPSGKVHTGFAQALEKNETLKRIKACIESKSSSNRVLLTGHSLGAALATLTATHIPSSHLYTFGSCRVGDESFSNSMSNVNHTRFVNCCDVVTSVPPQNFGYAHTGTLGYINRNGQLLKVPSEWEKKFDCFNAHVFYLFRYSFSPGSAISRYLADHSPINYVSGVMGLRTNLK